MAAKSPAAADKALQKIQEQITCGICLEPYTQPKMLKCFHVFCEKCLQTLVGDGRENLSCPHCRQDMTLPVGGVSVLQGAFYIHYLFDIQDILQKVSSSDQPVCNKCKNHRAVRFCRICGFVCQRCEEIHQEWDDLSTHDIIDLDTLTKDVTTLVPPLKKILFCSKHPAKEADVYCEECDELICRDCIIHVHRNHQCNLVSDSFPKHESEILASIKPVEEQIAMLTRAVESLDAECAVVTEQKTSVVAEIHTTITHLQQAMEVRKTELVCQAEQIAEMKLKTLTAQRDMLELQIAQRRSCKGVIEESRRTCNQGEILRMKRPLITQLDELNDGFRPETLTLVKQADLKFVHSLHELTKMCQQFGKVYCHPVCPENCRASGEVIKLVTRGQSVCFSVEALDSEGGACLQPVDSLRCELVTSDGSSRVRGMTIKRRDRNIYDITYKPQHIGINQLHILIEECPILNSPFTVTVLPNITAPINIIGDLNRPRGIAVREGGEVIVAERYSHCVSIFSANGEKKSFGSCGSAHGQLNNPKNVSIDAEENILVVELGNNRIQQFSSTGNHLKTVGTCGSGPLQFLSPRSIAVHSHSHKVYVVDTDNHRIQVLNSDLTYSSSFGSKGSNNEEFNHPYDISADSAGNVYVADMNNHRIQVFTANGKYLRQFGKKGRGDGELNQPVSVAVDTCNVVYVGEYWNSRISMFSTDGKFIKLFGSYGSGRGQFNSPYGIAIDKSGTVYVSDSGNNRIQIFS